MNFYDDYTQIKCYHQKEKSISELHDGQDDDEEENIFL